MAENQLAAGGLLVFKMIAIIYSIYFYVQMGIVYDLIDTIFLIFLLVLTITIRVWRDHFICNSS